MPEMLQYSFMVRALLGAAMVGALAPAFGVFLVLRRLSLIADTLSHVALAGVAIGLLTKTFPPYVALVATSLVAVAIEQLRSRRLLPGDAALAVFLYAALAVAVVIISVADGFNADLFGYLFGSVLSTTADDLWLLFGLLIAVFAFVTVFYSELAQSSFDPDLARISGVRVGLVNSGLAVLTAATITLAMRIVGVLLVGAMIVVPVLISLRLVTGLRATIVTASAVGLLVALGGVTVAFYTDVAAGGAVVLTGIVVLVSAEIWTFLRKKVLPPGRLGAGPEDSVG
jgi:zinc transport system permease protein